MLVIRSVTKGTIFIPDYYPELCDWLPLLKLLYIHMRVNGINYPFKNIHKIVLFLKIMVKKNRCD